MYFRFRVPSGWTFPSVVSCQPEVLTSEVYSTHAAIQRGRIPLSPRIPIVRHNGRHLLTSISSGIFNSVCGNLFDSIGRSAQSFRCPMNNEIESSLCVPRHLRKPAHHTICIPRNGKHLVCPKEAFNMAATVDCPGRMSAENRTQHHRRTTRGDASKH